MSSYWTSQALAFIRSEPLAWLRLLGRKFALLWNRTEMLDTESQESHAEWSTPVRLAGRVGHVGVLVPLAFLGVIVTWPLRRRLWVIYGISTAYAASVVMFYIFARYRYPLVPFLVLFAAAGLVALPRLRHSNAPSAALVAAVLAAGVAVAVLAPALVAIGAAFSAGRPIPFFVEFGVAAFDPLNPLRSTFETADGHLAYAWPMAVWYALQPIHWHWLGVIGLAVPVGLVAVLSGARRSAAGIATLVAWPAMVFGVLVLYPYQNPRFLLAMLPPIAILAAVGLGEVWELIRTKLPGRRAIGLALAALVIGANAGLAWRYADGFAARQAADLAAIRGLEGRIPSGAAVASIGATAVLRHDGREVTELYNLPDDAARELASMASFYVLVNAPSMRTQWAGTATGRAYDVLRAAPGFLAVDRAGAWTLFRAGPAPP